MEMQVSLHWQHLPPTCHPQCSEVPGTDGWWWCLQPVPALQLGFVHSESSEGMAPELCFSLFWYLKIFVGISPNTRSV